MSAAQILEEDPRLGKLLARVSEIPVLPHVVFKVMEISGSADSPGSELEKAIIVDPGFSSKLLVLANSAYYGLPRKITSIREAVMYLGFKAIRQMAMTVGVFDLFVGKNDKDSLRRRSWWRHSVDTAVCCRQIALQTKRLPAEDAYTSGLLHYIGKTFLDRFGEEPYEKVDMLVQHGIDARRAEVAVYGCDHIQVAIGAANRWKLPEELIAGLAYLDPVCPSNADAHRPACVALGSRISEIALEGFEDFDEVELPEWALEALGLTPADSQSLVIAGSEAIAAAAGLQF